jgi:hypothetical protein
MQPKFLVWKIGWAIVSLSEIEGMCGKNKKLWYIIFLRLLKCPCTNREGILAEFWALAEIEMYTWELSAFRGI